MGVAAHPVRFRFSFDEPPRYGDDNYPFSFQTSDITTHESTHPDSTSDGLSYTFFFPNGWGLRATCSETTDGCEEGLWEVSVLELEARLETKVEYETVREVLMDGSVTLFPVPTGDTTEVLASISWAPTTTHPRGTSPFRTRQTEGHVDALLSMLSSLPTLEAMDKVRAHVPVR